MSAKAPRLLVHSDLHFTVLACGGLAVKEYERAVIQAAMSASELTARKAMLLYPAIGEWEPSGPLLRDLTLPPRLNR